MLAADNVESVSAPVVESATATPAATPAWLNWQREWALVVGTPEYQRLEANRVRATVVSGRARAGAWWPQYVPVQGKVRVAPELAGWVATVWRLSERGSLVGSFEELAALLRCSPRSAEMAVRQLVGDDWIRTIPRQVRCPGGASGCPRCRDEGKRRSHLRTLANGYRPGPRLLAWIRRRNARELARALMRSDDTDCNGRNRCEPTERRARSSRESHPSGGSRTSRPSADGRWSGGVSPAEPRRRGPSGRTLARGVGCEGGGFAGAARSAGALMAATLERLPLRRRREPEPDLSAQLAASLEFAEATGRLPTEADRRELLRPLGDSGRLEDCPASWSAMLSANCDCAAHRARRGVA